LGERIDALSAHEMHSAEYNHIVIRLCRSAGELERVAGNIRNILDLRSLVIVRKDDRVQVFLSVRIFSRRAVMSRFDKYHSILIILIRASGCQFYFFAADIIEGLRGIHRNMLDAGPRRKIGFEFELI